MSFLSTRVPAALNTPERRKFIKYAMASVVSVITTEVLLLICLELLRIKASTSSLIASTIASVPSYYLNRNWVWRKTGRSHLRKEVIPFWIMVVIGLAFSWLAGAVSGSVADDITDSHALRSFIVVAANVGAFAILWVLKYIIFNKILFVHRPQDLEPALDGRSGLPT